MPKQAVNNEEQSSANASKIKKHGATLLSILIVTAVIAAAVLALPAGLPMLMGGIILGGATPFVIKPLAQAISKKVFKVKEAEASKVAPDRAKGSAIEKTATVEKGIEGNEVGKGDSKAESVKGSNKGKGEKALAMGIKAAVMMGVTALAVFAAASVFGVVGVVLAASFTFAYKNTIKRHVNNLGDNLAARMVHGKPKENEKKPEEEKNKGPSKVRRFGSGLLTIGVVTAIVATVALMLPAGPFALLGAAALAAATPFIVKPLTKAFSDKITSIKPEERKAIEAKNAGVEIDLSKPTKAKGKLENVVTAALKFAAMFAVTAFMAFGGAGVLGVVGVVGAAVLAHAYKEPIQKGIRNLANKVFHKTKDALSQDSKNKQRSSSYGIELQDLKRVPEKHQISTKVDDKQVDHTKDVQTPKKNNKQDTENRHRSNTTVGQIIATHNKESSELHDKSFVNKARANTANQDMLKLL